MRLSTQLLCATIALGVSACAGSSGTDAAAAEQAIRGHVAQWNEALATNNDSLIVSLHAADAVVMPPNHAALTGHDEIGAFWRQIGTLDADLRIAVESVDVADGGDIAVEQGTWTITVPMPEGAHSDNGKYIVVWTKEGGEWKVKRDIWNSDLLAPTAPADTATS